jgi:hypothetical protein
LEHLCRPNRGTIKCDQHIVGKSLTPLTIVLAALFLLCTSVVIHVVKTTGLSSPCDSEGPRLSHKNLILLRLSIWSPRHQRHATLLARCSFLGDWHCDAMRRAKYRFVDVNHRCNIHSRTLNSSWSGTGTVIVVAPLLLLHDGVAALLSDCHKTVLGHDFTNFSPREGTQLRHGGTSPLA